MKEEVVLDYLNKGLELVNKLGVPQLNNVPVAGPVLKVVTSILLDTVLGQTNDLFKDAYSRSIDLIYQPISSASPIRLKKFYSFYSDTLSKSIGEHIESNDVDYLKKAYPVLFKILVLDDLILTTVYFDEINEGHWDKIIEDFNKTSNKVTEFSEAVKLISPNPGDSDVISDIESFIREISSEFSSEYKNNSKFRDDLTKIVNNILGKKK